MKQLLINDEQLEARVALVQDKKLCDYFVQRKESRQLANCVIKGRINNHEPSLQAAFVDIGMAKNALLHYRDMFAGAGQNEDIETDEDNQQSSSCTQAGPHVGKNSVKSGRMFERLKQKFRAESGKKGKKGRRGSGGSQGQTQEEDMSDMSRLFPPNSEILVQVTKDPIGTKGARVTTNISIPGRYLVLLPNAPHVGVSKRIEDAKERERLRKILKRLDIPANMGLICRTAGAGKKESVFQRDFQALMKTWRDAEELMENKKAPCMVYEEPDLAEKTLRDFLTEDIDEIIADSKEKYDTAVRIVKKFSRQERVKVNLHKSASPIFKRYNLEKEIENIFSRKVPLPSGGYLCIDETEALTAVDVNSGRNKESSDHPETILNTNLEAVEEIARQLRLRNLGGLLVLDLIDMRDKRDVNRVSNALKKALMADRARTKVSPISAFGLVEMTRQREHESLKDTFYEACPYCNGRGMVKSATSVSVEIQRRLQALMRRKKHVPLRIIVNPRVLERLKNQDSEILQAMEEKLGGELSFRADPEMHVEEFHLYDMKTGKEY